MLHALLIAVGAPRFKFFWRTYCLPPFPPLIGGNEKMRGGGSGFGDVDDFLGRLDRASTRR